MRSALLFFRGFLLICCPLLVLGSICFPSNWLLISSRERSHGSEQVVFYDSYGDIPQIKYTYAAVERGVSIAALRNKNYTLLAFNWPNTSALQIPMGAYPLHTLSSSHINSPSSSQLILVTGLAGDCRRVLGFAKETALNLTYEFGGPPSGRLIASKVGALLQEATGGGSRPLAVHVIIADGLNGGTLLEVDLTGTVTEVWGAVGGKGSKEGLRYLEDRWTDPLSCSLEEAEKTLREAMERMAEEAAKMNREEDDGGSGFRMRETTITRLQIVRHQLDD